MEIALVQMSRRVIGEARDCSLLDELPFDTERKRVLLFGGVLAYTAFLIISSRISSFSFDRSTILLLLAFCL